jgi:hypothetical protein
MALIYSSPKSPLGQHSIKNTIAFGFAPDCLGAERADERNNKNCFCWCSMCFKHSQG